MRTQLSTESYCRRIVGAFLGDLLRITRPTRVLRHHGSCRPVYCITTSTPQGCPLQLEESIANGPHEIGRQVLRQLAGALDETQCLVVEDFGDAHAPLPPRNPDARCVALEQRPKARVELRPCLWNTGAHGIDQRRVGERAHRSRILHTYEVPAGDS